MKPIIIEMNDMSESVEVYQSKPNPFLVYTIYLIIVALAIVCIWMHLFKMDDVVKSDGIFKNADSIYDISSVVTGQIDKCNVENGEYVEEGETLYEVKIESLSDTIRSYQNDLKDVEGRLDILDAYDKSLDGDEKLLNNLIDNPYYEEFVNKRELLMANIESSQESTESQKEIYEENVATISDTIDKYNNKINKLNILKKCIIDRNNIFDSSESYYYNLVNSYISSYNYSMLQYDNKNSDFQIQIDEIDEQIKNASEETDVESLKKLKDSINESIESVWAEKEQALLNLEISQISTIEKDIESLNNTLLTLNTNLNSAKLELNAVGKSVETSKKIAILTEKGNITSEKLTYEEKKKECKNYLKSYDIQNDNCIIKASTSGYYYGSQDLKQGSYIQEGLSLGKIYPEDESEFYAEIYVKNSDIGKITEGQAVKFEIAAYPSREYGYFTGEVSSISKDITVDENTDYAYYSVKVKCDNMTLKSRDGDDAYLKNGMSCNAKIIIGERSVMRYLLEKINLLD